MLVEDAACAAGSTYNGQPIGADARLAAFSFHPRKILTTGEGGMLVTNDAEIATRERRLREHGMSVSAIERHQHNRPVVESYLETGFNRMTDVQAAIELVQLDKLEVMISRVGGPGRPVPPPSVSSKSCRWRPTPRHHQLPVVLVVLPDDLAVDRNVYGPHVAHALSTRQHRRLRTSSRPTAGIRTSRCRSPSASPAGRSSFRSSR